MSQQFIDENEDIGCCFGFCPAPRWKPLEIEMSFDENDNDIIFKKKNCSSYLQNEPFTFYCSRFQLGNQGFLLRKISTDGNICIVLICKEDENGRTLQGGFLIVNGNKFKVTDFKPHRRLIIGEDIYNWVCECTYDTITSLDA
uniref:Uncharacterized protein n=1 Tax=viral metagenome TaxID=1070528 RepID=A0A6C0ASC4_9ZZZZ